MEHIRQIDWCYMEGDTQHFLTEEDIDNSCTERILRNQFFNPLLSEDEDDGQPGLEINWDEVFSKNQQNNQRKNDVFVPCMRQTPCCPKLSALTREQQLSCLKVICGEYRHVLENSYLPRATKQDHRLFEDLKPTYLQEQNEYIQWAKSLWTSTHCVRALRPKPEVEMVYDAEFHMKMSEFQSLPRNYELAAQIPLSTSSCDGFEIVHQKDLVNVNINALPIVYFPELFTRKVNIMKSSNLPQPCERHPCRFILPTEDCTSILSLTEIYTELAQYALEKDARFVASETALRCLIETDRSYTLPVTVCNVTGPDGDSHKIVILGNEFAVQRESSQVRTYRAFRRLLQDHLISDTEKQRVKDYWEKQLNNKTRNGTVSEANNTTSTSDDTMMEDSDDDDDEQENLVIDMDNTQVDKEPDEAESVEEGSSDNKVTAAETTASTSELNKPALIGESVPKVFTCTCKDGPYHRPPPRSFRKWRVRNNTGFGNLDIIVHCSHKMRTKSGEVIVEPIPEYQLDLGASEQSPERVKSLALSLILRRNASLVNVRVDGPSGDLATYEHVSLEDLNKKYDNVTSYISNIIHTTLSQLDGLLPGNYVLKHDPEQHANALLYVARRQPRVMADALSLQFDVTQLGEPDESKMLKQAPTLSPVLLPWHKFRKILPLAFTWSNKFLLKEQPSRKPQTKQKTPPQAIKWPKKRKKNKKTN